MTVTDDVMWTSVLFCSPQAVENFTIRINSDHDVLCGGVMNKGTFRMDEENVRYPDLLHQSTIEGHAFIGFTGKRQTLVLPVVS